MSTSTNTRRQRCAGSKLALADTVPSTTDQFHHYSATCPTCGRSFLLPQYALPIHYVDVPADLPRAESVTLEPLASTAPTSTPAYVCSGTGPAFHVECAFTTASADDAFKHWEATSHAVDATDDASAVELYGDASAPALEPTSTVGTCGACGARQDAPSCATREHWLPVAADQPELSTGHIAIVNGYEYYVIGAHVYMAPMSAPVADVRTGTRIGRWECSLEHWRAYDRLAMLQRVYGAPVPA